MKKKSQRFSVKRITPTHRRNQVKINQQLRNNIEKPKSQRKNKSYQKVYQYPQTYQKFKIMKPGGGNGERQRIKTEADETSIFKNPYEKFLNFEKKDKMERYKFKPQSTGRGKDKNYQSSFYNDKTKMNKKLYIDSDLFKKAKNSSLEKKQGPLTGKDSLRQHHDSYRQKKTALERYISQSLESLQHPKKKKNQEIVTSPRKEGQETLLKQKRKYGKELRIFEDATKEVQQERTPKYLNNLVESKKKFHTQKDESLEKFQIKFQKKKKNPYQLSRQEQQIFGDRFPDGFQKIKLLGRGGFSLVWLGEHQKSRKKYAVKQIITESTHQTHIKQIWFGTYFFEFGGAPKEAFANSPGINNLVKLYYYFINKKDTWILYQKCGDSLGNSLYQLKGEHSGGEKIYRILYKPLYNSIRKNQNQLRKIIVQVAKALQLLAQNNIVHSDLKTQNILVRTKEEKQLQKGQISVAETKLIDYGSSFVFNNLRQFSMATPEYMAPEILNFILYENQMEYIPKLFQYVQKYKKPWVIDVWSLGCVILQIVSGIPLWMSLKTVVRKKSTQFIKYGLFAIKGRLFDKIIRRQIEVVQNLDHYLSEQNYSGIVLEEDIKALLKKMLALNPQKRISPSQIVSFFEDSSNQNQKQ